MREGQQREWGKQATRTGTKHFIESKHDPKARERMRRSPDLFDCTVTGIEGARQLGFRIHKLGAVFTEKDEGFKWLTERAKKHFELRRSKQLVHS